MEMVVKRINELCKLHNFRVAEAASMNRCLNEQGEMLIAYTKRSRTVKIYIDSIKDLREIFNESHPIINQFSINRVITARDEYFSNQLTISTIEEAEKIISMLEELLRMQNSLRKFKAPRRSMSTRVQEIVELAKVELKRSLKFGVELELTVRSKNELVRELEEAGVKVVTPNSTHQVVHGWKAVYDGSIKAERGYEGVELVSPPSTNFDDLEKVCKVLKKIGAKVNSSCGLHVHHDISDLKRRQILRVYNFYNKYEKVINLMMPKHRVNNRFCKPVSEIISRVNDCNDKEELLKRVAGKGMTAYYNSCRYYTVNLRSFLFYGTIEFRQGFATTDFEIISNWILFTHKIIERSLEIENDIVYNLDNASLEETFIEMIKEIKVENTALSNNLKGRFKRYKRRAA